MTRCWGWCWACCAPMRRGRSWARRRTGPGGRCCCRTCWPRPATSSPFPARRSSRAGRMLSWLLDRAATYLQVHARLAEARPLAERALAIDEAAYGPDHPDVATGLNNLALILAGPGPAGSRPGRWPNAPWPSPRPPTAPTTPTSPSGLNNLALILQDLGQPAEARPLAERALAIDEAAYGPDHPDVAHPPEQPRHHPGRTWASRQQARPLAERALAIDRGRLRPRPPRRRHPPEQPRPHPAGPGPAGRGPAAGRTRPGHRRGRLRPRPPRRRHRPEQPRPHPGRTWASRQRPGRWPNAPWPSPRPPTAPTTPPSPSA